MTCGVYCFRHKFEPFIYIGSSQNIEERYKQHLSGFNAGSHTNKALMNDFLDDNLDFKILNDYLPAESLKNIEQDYIEKYLDFGFLLYNKLLPNPQGYANSMLCSKDIFSSSQKDLLIENWKLEKEWLNLKDDIFRLKRENEWLNNQNFELKRQIHHLNRENTELMFICGL